MPGQQQFFFLTKKFNRVDAGIDGELLLLMVEDFDEFSALVSDPGDRLRIKKSIKILLETAPPVS